MNRLRVEDASLNLRREHKNMNDKKEFILKKEFAKNSYNAQQSI